MSYFNAATPQLRLVDQSFKAYRTRDLNNAARFFSRNFTHKWFPKIAELPDETKEEHIDSLGSMLARLAKFDVSSRDQGSAFELHD